MTAQTSDVSDQVRSVPEAREVVGEGGLDDVIDVGDLPLKAGAFPDVALEGHEVNLQPSSSVKRGKKNKPAAAARKKHERRHGSTARRRENIRDGKNRKRQKNA